jgi:hypothetical protein
MNTLTGLESIVLGGSARDTETPALCPIAALPGLLAVIVAWTLGEVVMAPMLRSYLALLMVSNGFCFAAVLIWYYRMNRLFPSTWTRLGDGVVALSQAIAPLQLLLPFGLLAHAAGDSGPLLYELAKAGVVISLLPRTTEALQKLTGWPAWAATLLMITPAVLAAVALVLFTFVMGIVVLGLMAGAFAA